MVKLILRKINILKKILLLPYNVVYLINNKLLSFLIYWQFDNAHYFVTYYK